MTAGWIFSASGYYRYDEGFTPHFEGQENFRGQVIHPQHWPEDLDYSGKRVIVIGSGATAMTLVPGDGREGGPRDDAAALADLRPAAARGGQAQQPAARDARRGARLQDHAHEEHRAPADLLLPLPPLPASHAPRHPPDQRRAPTRARPGRRPLQADATTRGTSVFASSPTPISTRPFTARPHRSPPATSRLSPRTASG